MRSLIEWGRPGTIRAAITPAVLQLGLCIAKTVIGIGRAPNKHLTLLAEFDGHP